MSESHNPLKQEKLTQDLAPEAISQATLNYLDYLLKRGQIEALADDKYKKLLPEQSLESHETEKALQRVNIILKRIRADTNKINEDGGAGDAFPDTDVGRKDRREYQRKIGRAHA